MLPSSLTYDRPACAARTSAGCSSARSRNSTKSPCGETRALSSNIMLASGAIRSPAPVRTNGLIFSQAAIREPRTPGTARRMKAFGRAKRLCRSAPTGRPACGPGRDTKPSLDVQTVRGRFFPACASATSSMFMPPSVETISTGALGRPDRRRCPGTARGRCCSPLRPAPGARFGPAGPGLHGDQRLAEQVAGYFGPPAEALLDQLDAVLLGVGLDGSLAAAAGMNLGFDHRDRSAQRGEKPRRPPLGGAGDNVTGRHGHAGCAQDLFGLIFVDFVVARSRRSDWRRRNYRCLASQGSSRATACGASD